jgi:hypothetical protein
LIGPTEIRTHDLLDEFLAYGWIAQKSSSVGGVIADGAEGDVFSFSVINPVV